MGPHTQSAGTAEIARRSGGDSMPVDGAYAFQDTLARLRQRYALYFYLPAGVKAGQERNIEVALADSAMRRYPGADVRYRRTYMAPSDAGQATPAPTVVSQAPVSNSSGDAQDRPPVLRRRPAVDGPTGGGGPMVGASDAQSSSASSRSGTSSQGGWRQTDQPAAPAEAPAKASPPADQQQPSTHGGWR